MIKDERVQRANEWGAYTRALAAWCLRNFKQSIADDELEAALKWGTLAARVYSNECDSLVSAELERNLLEIARRLPTFTWTPTNDGNRAKRWLHVIDQPRPYGGLTAIVKRWISSDPGFNIHSALLLSPSSIPSSLAEAIQVSGGEILTADACASMLSRALWLREQAFSKADYVVLHIDCWNVMVPVAFGVEGGPPVLLDNHAAHLFWLGGPVVDLVLNCRGSELETEWTVRYRGIPRCATLPIPLPVPVKEDDGNLFSAASRSQARRQLGIPLDAVVLLSIGRDLKYKPIPGLNFLQVADIILAACPQAYLVVVGPTDNKDWAALAEKFGGRAKVPGLQCELRTYHSVADIYIEGFPFGSATALLEAGSHGIPCVLAPAECPPPFGTDGIALDGVLARPSDTRDYVNTVISLVKSPAERERCGRLLAHSILEHHTDSGWVKYLDAAIQKLPVAHSVYPVVQPESPPTKVVHYWAEFTSYWTTFIGRFNGDPLEYPFGLGLKFGLQPRLDRDLRKACRDAARIRRAGGSPLALYWLLGVVLPFLPLRSRFFIFDKLVILTRANGLVRRFARSVLRLQWPRDDWGRLPTSNTDDVHAGARVSAR